MPSIEETKLAVRNTVKTSKKATLISPTRAFSQGLVLHRNGIVHHKTVHIFRLDRAVMANNTERRTASNERNRQFGDPLEQ